MPTSLRDAHKKLDAAVDKLYRKEKFINEADRVGYLFDLYQQLAAPTDVPAPPASKRGPRKSTASHGSEE